MTNDQLMYKIKNKKPQGFIAIVSLLIITTISMIFAMSMLKEGVANASLSLSSIYYEKARMNAVLCLEDTMLRLKLEEQFDKDLNYLITDGEGCSTTIGWYTPQQVAPGITETLVDLQIVGTSNNFTRSFNYGLKITKYDVNYSDGSLEYMNSIDIISLEEITS